jgi:glycerol uptake facilitator-like aquaporin
VSIGAAVFIGALVAGPLTGAAMNPARALAPAVVANHWAGLLVHLAGPLVGGVVGMAAYEAVRRGRKPKPGEALGADGPIDLEADG